MSSSESARGGAQDRAGDGGFVTAEAAVVLPVLVLFAMGLVWALLAVAAQIQCVDAARAGARASARQDPDTVAVAVARQAAPAGARVTVRREGDLVRVKVEAPVPGPDVFMVRVRHEAVALAEETIGGDEVAGSGDTAGAEEGDR
ncbi:TadE family type IV pilus minor pilin [Streptomyces sp. NPDC091292]|uniref:TadE family type IV pilus minor pilin n=1 Tax=Streptomyces sp. NPDC091292 TaxID=3365991 RepID=UPI0037FF95A8